MALTLTGTGEMNVVNDGGVLTSTNTGGNGLVTVNASGSTPITLTHTGDDDITYP